MQDGSIEDHIKSVVGLGDPIVDVLVPLSHANFDDLGLQRGGSTPLDTESISQLLSQIPDDTSRNKQFQEHLQLQNVDPLLLTSEHGTPTASCICLITPDGERTMRPYLGAAAELKSAKQLPKGWTQGCRLLHCEGYCLYRPELAAGAMQAAKAAGAEVSLDTASFEVVTNCWSSLLPLLQQGLVDVLLCNEEEALAVAKMAGISVQGGAQDAVQNLRAVQKFLLQYCKVCIISRGSKPCLVQTATGEQLVAATLEVQVKDTVGAGDCFAAGFLHAYLAGASLQAQNARVCCDSHVEALCPMPTGVYAVSHNQVCAQCACILGAAAVGTAGAELPAGQWQQLQAKVASLLPGHVQSRSASGM